MATKKAPTQPVATVEAATPFKKPTMKLAAALNLEADRKTKDIAGLVAAMLNDVISDVINKRELAARMQKAVSSGTAWKLASPKLLKSGVWYLTQAARKQKTAKGHTVLDAVSEPRLRLWMGGLRGPSEPGFVIDRLAMSPDCEVYVWI